MAKVIMLGLTMMTLAVLLLCLNKGSEAQEHFRSRWNTTTFDPAEQPELKEWTDKFAKLLSDGTFSDPKNRDRLVSWPAGQVPPVIYVRAGCTSGVDDGDCDECLKAAATEMTKLCVNCYGVDVESDNCYVRFETYSF